MRLFGLRSRDARPCALGRKTNEHRTFTCKAQALNMQIVGTWQKDMTRSTPMDAAADLVGLSGLVKEGVKLIRGFELAIEDPFLRISVFSILPLVKIEETYLLDGSGTSNMRRDLRFGKATGILDVTAEGLPLLRLHWDGPYAGEGVDQFQLVGPDELHVTSTVIVNGNTVSYTSVHTRKK